MCSVSVTILCPPRIVWNSEDGFLLLFLFCLGKVLVPSNIIQKCIFTCDATLNVLFSFHDRFSVRLHLDLVSLSWLYWSPTLWFQNDGESKVGSAVKETFRSGEAALIVHWSKLSFKIDALKWLFTGESLSIVAQTFARFSNGTEMLFLEYFNLENVFFSLPN